MKVHSDSLALNASRYLRNELKKRGMTQEEFADSIYSNVRTVSRWLKDGINKLDTIEFIARYFQVDPMDIISDGDDAHPFFGSRYS